MRCSSIAVLLAIALPAMNGWTNVASLNPLADATLFEVEPDNSGGGQDFFIAGTTQNHKRNRGLLRFDLAAAGIPTDATILSATLNLDVVHTPADGLESSLFGLHRVLRPWGEGSTVAEDNAGGRGAPAQINDATWNFRFFNTDPWAAPGGVPGIDYFSDFSTSALVSGIDTYIFESTLSMVADAQFWANHPGNNYGWMLISESEDSPFTARRFASRENPGGGPVLTIEYVLVPEPSVGWLAGLGCVGLWALRKVKRRN